MVAASPSTLLAAQIGPVCPIVSVGVGDPADRASWSVAFAPEATPSQIAAANNIIATFDLVSAVAAANALTMGISADADFRDVVSKLRNASPAQIRTYVANNVTDLPSAKTLLAKILIFLSASLN